MIYQHHLSRAHLVQSVARPRSVILCKHNIFQLSAILIEQLLIASNLITPPLNSTGATGEPSDVTIVNNLLQICCSNALHRVYLATRLPNSPIYSIESLDIYRLFVI